MNGKKIRLFSVITAAVLLIMSVGAGAWFVINRRTADTGSLVVENPPIIFIRDNEATPDDNLQVLNLENMIIGQTSYIVFCVVPREENKVAKYSIQLAFTTNMNETINLYPVTGASAAQTAGAVRYGDYYYTCGARLAYIDGSVDIPDLGETFYGSYQRYTERSFEDDFSAYPAGLTANLTMNEANFYLVEITWADGATAGIDQKETDILYVYVKATEMVTA